MEKIILLVSLVSTSFIFAQQDADKSKETVDFYIGLGLNSQNQFKLNSKLNSADLPELKETMPEFHLGMNVFGEKYSGDVEFGFLYAEADKANVENKYMSFSVRLKAHYNLINKEKTAFTGGLSFAITNAEADIFAKNNTIDLNNFSPSNISHVSLKNQMFYVGPSVALYVLKHKSSKIRINLGYEFAFTNGKWKSDFTSVQNTIKENGTNRLVFGISLL
uniref:hypothetical protein n=1 Tax=Flavobacterium sp. TaxID=239 RepID=UPI004049DF76